mmetsp:Transcript_8708/g.21261  ORF Transcript_8708/g.21261 Transcript_8708/m.21261 type:complete len:85 (+) Transcript_8708:306-560(+)
MDGIVVLVPIEAPVAYVRDKRLERRPVRGGATGWWINGIELQPLQAGKYTQVFEHPLIHLKKGEWLVGRRSFQWCIRRTIRSIL